MPPASNRTTPFALRQIATTLIEAPVGSVRKRRQLSSYSLKTEEPLDTPQKKQKQKQPRRKNQQKKGKGVKKGEDEEDLTDLSDLDEAEEDLPLTPMYKKNGGSKVATPLRTPRSVKKDENGEDLWDVELDKLLRVGLEKIPSMGRRSIVLKSDGDTYGRVALLSEFLRRQTGKIRNKTQMSSHLMIQRKHAVKIKDRESLALIDGIALPPRKDLYKIDFDKVLGPDKFPHTRKAALEENAKVKALRVALLEKRKEEAGETSGRQGSVTKRKRKRDDSDSEEESEEEEDAEEEEDEKIVAPPSKKRKRQNSPEPLLPPSRPKKKPGRPRKQADESTSPFAKPKPAPKKRQPRASTSTSSAAKIAKPASPRKSKLSQSVVNIETTGDPDGYESSDLSSVESSDEEEEEEEKPKKVVPPSVKGKELQVGKRKGVQTEMKEEELEGPETEAIEEPEQAVETPPSAESMDVDTEDPKPQEEVVDSQTSTSSWLTGGLKKVFSWLG